MRLIIRNIRVVDEIRDTPGSVIIEDGFIRDFLPGLSAKIPAAGLVIDGSSCGARAVLMPAFIDLHAHFRDPGFPDKETLESASLAAAAGGYGTVICMANTNPVIDTPEAAAALRARSNALGLTSLFPVISLTKNMEGRELSAFPALRSPRSASSPLSVRMLSEDGKDIADDALFLAVLGEARRLGLPVSCHCDAGGAEAEAAKRAGLPREFRSRIEENAGTRRAIALGKEARCHIHIAHVSTAEAAALVREAKSEAAALVRETKNGADVEAAPAETTRARPAPSFFTLSAEAAPHHIALTEADARSLGAESHGRVNPPLRTEADRQAVIAALLDGTIDAIATDHAPHSAGDKAAGAPGFTGLETAFAVCRTELVREGRLDLSGLSRLMSAAPARILGLSDRGRIEAGQRADLVIVDSETVRRIRAEAFISRGKNSPFAGRELKGRVLLTIHRGRIVFDRRD